MANGAVQIDRDPVILAMTRARVGAPLSDEERLARDEGAASPWISAAEMTAEIALRAPSSSGAPSSDPRCAGK